MRAFVYREPVSVVRDKAGDSVVEKVDDTVNVCNFELVELPPVSQHEIIWEFRLKANRFAADIGTYAFAKFSFVVDHRARHDEAFKRKTFEKFLFDGCGEARWAKYDKDWF